MATTDRATYGDKRSPWKQPVRVASAEPVTIATPGATIDGVTLAVGDRVLLKDQVAGAANGIYVFQGAASPMTRAEDADLSEKVYAGMACIVEEGTANGSEAFFLTTPNPIVLGTTELEFSGYPLTELAGAEARLDALDGGSAAATPAVLESLTITTTAPLTIGGGASADLSANRTLAITAASGGGDGSMSAAHYTKLEGIEAAADVTDAANVAAAGAVMDSDFAGSHIGTLQRTGAGAYRAVRNNLAASAPAVTDDEADGYGEFSLWIDTGGPDIYMCTDPTAAAAVWVKIFDTP